MFGILTQALAWPGMEVCPQVVYCNTCLMLGGQTLDPDNELTSFIRDALRFISAFMVPISESAPHIYLSALPFSPEHSLVADKFCSRFPNTLKIIEGRPVEWPMTIFTAEHHNDGVECIVFSPDEKTFASMSVPIQEKIATMYICDSETGHCISGPFESKVKNPHCHGGYLDPDGNIFWPSAGNLQWSGTLGGVRSSLNLKPTILPLFVMVVIVGELPRPIGIGIGRGSGSS